MKYDLHTRNHWLSTLNTRELVILLLELAQVSEEQPELRSEVDEACTALREELLNRERPTPVISG